MSTKAAKRPPRIHVIGLGAADVGLVDAVAAEIGAVGMIAEVPTVYDSAVFPWVAKDDATHFLFPLLFGFRSDGDVIAATGCSRAEAGHRRARVDQRLAAMVRELAAKGIPPERLVILQTGDFARVMPSLSRSVVFMHSAMRRGQAGLHALPYFLEADVPRSVPPITAASRAVSFRGAIGGVPLRERLVAAAGRWAAGGLDVSCKVINYPSISDGVARQRARADYFAEMTASRFVLCPRGTGTSSIRFYETLAVGRIPILVADTARLPLEGQIDYEHFVLRLPEDRLDELPERLAEFQDGHDLAAASLASTRAYDEHFAAGRFHAFLSAVLAPE